MRMYKVKTPEQKSIAWDLVESIASIVPVAIREGYIVFRTDSPEFNDNSEKVIKEREDELQKRLQVKFKTN